MKMPGLLRTLAALLVVVPATLATVEVSAPVAGTGLRRRWCPGCYSTIMQIEHQPHRPLEDVASITELLKSVKLPPLLEDSVLTPSPQIERKRSWIPCVGCFGPLDDSKMAARVKREERKAASLRRRGKLPGTRPVCRGCFSGLMLTGRPAEGGIAEGTVPKSISKSEENSSGGD